jgi:hypothetical protein
LEDEVGHKYLLCSSETIKQNCTKFNFFSSSFALHILYHMTTTQQKEKEENEEEEEEEEGGGHGLLRPKGG